MWRLDLGTKAGKLPISTMSLKWLNLNFDKAADGEGDEEQKIKKKQQKKKTLLKTGSQLRKC